MTSRLSLLLLVLGPALAGPALSQRGNPASQTATASEPPKTAAASPQELFKRLSPSVFVVEAVNERGSVVVTGSGVAVAPGDVVTNKHVIEEGVAWRVRHGGKTWTATLTHLDPDHDLCQLKADGLKAPHVPVRASSTLAVGERVYAIGAPEGLELSLSEGLISGLREFEEVRLIQTSAPISPGSSGGGLFDTQGRLVGITTFFLKEGQNLNFALPGEWVQALATQQFSARPKTETDSPAFQALQWFQLGNAAYDAGEYEKAVRAYREVVRLKPDYAVAWNNLGTAHNRLRQYDQAARAYKEAIRLKPDYAEAWSNLGAAYDHSRQYEQAVRAYQESIRLKPDYAEAWNNLGNAYSDLGRLNQAVKAYEEAVRLKPEDAVTWYNLGVAYARQGNRSKVMQVYEKLKALDPTEADRFFQKFVLP